MFECMYFIKKGHMEKNLELDKPWTNFPTFILFSGQFAAYFSEWLILLSSSCYRLIRCILQI